MNAILYFVAAGVVQDSHKAIAATIHKETGKRVVFRNGIHRGETPEANEGVAGHVPKAYAHFPHYNDAGTLISGPASVPPPKDVKLNSIGLPEGSPEDREGLKAALEAEGVVFHANAKLDKLVDLYADHFFPETEE